MNVRCFCLFLCCVSLAHGQDWNRFRGPNGSGIGNLPVNVPWSTDDYQWHIDLPGAGHSSPVLWQKRLYLTAGDEETGTRSLLSVETETGKIAWKANFPAEKHGKHKLNTFASSTPAVDDKHIYLAWGSPDDSLAMAVNHTGETVWKTSLGPYKAGHGYGVSPIVQGELVILTHEHEGESSILALDRSTGEIRWRVPRKSKATYSTPCVGGGESKGILCSNWTHGITALDPSTGRNLWELDVFNKEHIETAIGSPVTAGGLVFAACGWLGVRQELIAVRPPGNQQEKPEVVYRIERNAPLTTTPLVSGDLLFLWSDQGIVTCAQAATGEIHWRERVGGTYYGSPVATDGKLFCLNADGDVVVLAASTEFRELARISLGQASNSTPAIGPQAIYFRTVNRLYALGEKRPAK